MCQAKEEEKTCEKYCYKINDTKVKEFSAHTFKIMRIINEKNGLALCIGQIFITHTKVNKNTGYERF